MSKNITQLREEWLQTLTEQEKELVGKVTPEERLRLIEIHNHLSREYGKVSEVDGERNSHGFFNPVFNIGITNYDVPAIMRNIAHILVDEEVDLDDVFESYPDLVKYEDFLEQYDFVPDEEQSSEEDLNSESAESDFHIFPSSVDFEAPAFTKTIARNNPLFADDKTTDQYLTVLSNEPEQRGAQDNDGYLNVGNTLKRPLKESQTLDKSVLKTKTTTEKDGRENINPATKPTTIIEGRSAPFNDLLQKFGGKPKTTTIR